MSILASLLFFHKTARSLESLVFPSEASVGYMAAVFPVRRIFRQRLALCDMVSVLMSLLRFQVCLLLWAVARCVCP